MSEEEKLQADGIKVIPDPEMKTVWWYLTRDRLNTRLPKPLSTVDVIEDECKCNCEVITEVVALDLVKLILSSEQAIAQVPIPPFLQELQEITGVIIPPPQVESPDTVKFETQVMHGLASVSLCEQKCPEVTVESIWERAEEILEEEFITNELQQAFKEGMTDEGSLKSELEGIRSIAKNQLAKYQRYGAGFKRIRLRRE